MSVISGTIAALEGRKSAKEANEANRQNAVDTNTLNREMFDLSRGSEGNSLLPTYMTTPAGTPWERDVLARDLMGLWESGGTVDEQISRGKEITDSFRGVQGQASSAAKGIFNGGLETQLSSALEPVKQKRIKMAGTARQAAMDSLQDSLAEIETLNARRGFSGDSMTNQRLKFDARRRSSQDAAGALAQAELQNAIDEQALKTYIANLQLQNLGLPAAQAAREMGMETLAGDVALDNFSKRLQPLTFLRLGQGAYQYNQLPREEAVPSTLGLAAFGASQAGGTALDAWLNSDRFRSTPTATGASPGMSWGQFASGYNAGGGAPYGGTLVSNGAGGANIARSASDWAKFEAEQAKWM